ncbi:hypothetical protein N431DRAFT_379518 [Stipitochalara longipes BDJ]|nr:hypothetical protein N431DRAFT_379518 [Stipitochalara longipes BDJ]
MPSILRTGFLVGGLLAAGSWAGPVVVRDVEVYPLAAGSRAGQVAARGFDVPPYIQERGFAPIILGNYSLQTYHVDHVLFDLSVTDSLSHGFANTVELELECVDCRTWGSALVTTTGVDKDESIIGDIISFFENPIDSIVNAFDMEVKIEFIDVGGHFEFDLVASDTISYSYTIWNSDTLAGLAISSDVSIGLVVFIDLVFSLTAEIDLEAGFEFAFPEGAYITVDPLEGKIIDHGFTGGDTNSLPIICTSGSATFKAAVRVRLQAGTTVAVFGTGFDFSLGVYADLIEYVATLETTPVCELEITELLDVNVGAYAHAVVELDYLTLGVSPAVVTTLLDIPLPSLCVTRPYGSSLPAFPTSAPLSVISTTVSSQPTKTPIPSSAYASATSTGGIFLEGSTSSIAAATSAPANSTLILKTGSLNATSTGTAPAASTYALNTGSSNVTSTITSSASLITSTVWTTEYITVTSCSSTVLHCPASAASEIILTSTSILYTTVCPYGAILPTTLPVSNLSQSIAPQLIINTELVSPLPLTPATNNVVSTVYIPTFVNPTYTIPTATSFPVAYPNWSANLGTATVVAQVVATPITAPSPSGVPIGAGNGTVVGTAKVTPTSAPFTGAGGKENARLALVAFAAAGLLLLL